MEKTRVLFVCNQNSARSQMAEAFLNNIAGDRFEAHSAGIEPGELNPLAVDAMKEVHIDISKNRTKSVFDLYKQGELYAHVITVCDAANVQRCPGLATASPRDEHQDAEIRLFCTPSSKECAAPTLQETTSRLATTPT